MKNRALCLLWPVNQLNLMVLTSPQQMMAQYSFIYGLNGQISYRAPYLRRFDLPTLPASLF